MLTRFSGLCGFVNQDGLEFQFAEPGVSRADTSAANDLRCQQNLLLALSDEALILPLIVRAQLSLLVLKLDKLLEFDVRGVVCDLVMKRQECDGRIERLTRLGRKPHDFEPRGVDLFSELINSDVRRRADEDLAWVHLGEVINNRSRSNGFASARRSLDQADRLLKDAFDSIHLGVVELGQTRSGEAFGHLGTKNLRLELVTKEFVILFIVS
jgi:hypothetical protein